MKRYFGDVKIVQVTRVLYATCVTCVSALIMTSCYDDTFSSVISDMNSQEESTRAYDEEVTIDESIRGNLVQNSDGTWTANARVPLVGAGRVVNQVSKSTVSLISGTNNIGAVVDEDLTNTFSVGGVVGVDLGTASALAVRDIYRIYSKGQKVGFVINPGEENKLLGLDLLSGMSIEFYCYGDKKETVKIENEGDNSALGLDLLGFSNKGNTEQSISVDAPCDFDEIRLDLSGINISALSTSFGIKYAFVGENLEEIAVKNNDSGFPCINTDLSSNNDFSNLLDDKLTENYITIRPVSVLPLPLPEQYVTINFGKDLRGYEVGCAYEVEGLGNIVSIDNLLSNAPVLVTYDSQNKEITESSTESSLISLDVLKLNNNISKVSMNIGDVNESVEVTQFKIRVPFTLVNINLIKVYYAYIRKPVTLDLSTYFAFPGAIIYSSSYKLPEPQKDASGNNIGSVQYYLLQGPSSATNAKIENGKLIGADVEGAYIVQAVYEKDGLKMSCKSTIYRKKRMEQAAGCNTYITTESYGAYPTETVEAWGGSLISILSGLKNPDAVVDNDYNNYASNTGISLITHAPVYAMKTTRKVNEEKLTVRTGFSVCPNVGLLDLGLLDKFELRLYNGTERVDISGGSSSGEDSEVLGLDLIGDGDGRMRIYAETNKTFDRLELWHNDLTNISLFSQFRIYNAFVEDVTCATSSVQDLCMEVMNNSNYNVNIDYSVFNDFGLFDAVSSIDNLGYLIDNDLDTGVETGGLLGSRAVTFGFTFDTMDANQPIGAVLDGMGGLLDLSLLSNITLQAFKDNYDGEPVCEKSSFDLLDLNLIQSTGKMYLEMTPTAEYNRLKLTINTGLSALNGMKVTGLYTRKDSDGDGIPDCVDPGDVVDNAFSFSKGEVCYPGDLVLNVTGNYVENQEYIFKCKNNTTKEEFQKTIVIDSSTGSPKIILEGLSPGEYSVTAYSSVAGTELYNQTAYVYPGVTEWKGINNDWNYTNNWSDGKPAECTDVIIPKGVPNYPVLSEESVCANIHFEEGAYIQNIYLLKYELAFVDMLFKGGEYSFVTMPLKETFSGDLFVNTNINWTKENYFRFLNSGNYPESRVNPIVYQQIAEKADATTGEGGTYIIDENGNKIPLQIGSIQTWTSDFNYLAYEHVPGKAVKVKPGNYGEGYSYRFRFPKSGYNQNQSSSATDIYNYYYSNGSPAGKTEQINREKNSVGKIVTDQSYTVECKLSESSGYVGNPYLSVISIQDFFNYNQKIVSIFFPVTGVKITSDGLSSTSDNSKKRTFIYPCEAFRVSVGDNSGLESLDVVFKSNTGSESDPAAGENSDSGNTLKKNFLYIEAYGENNTSYASVMKAGGKFNDSFDEKIVIEDSDIPTVSVFTLQDNAALSINCVGNESNIDKDDDNNDKIPVGFIVNGSSKVKLRILTSDSHWKKWALVDSLTGNSYSLDNGEVVVDIGNIKSNISRFYLTENWGNENY